MHIIQTHENADFDAVASMLAAHKLNPDAIPILPDRLNTNVARFISLYGNGLPFIAREDFRAANVEQITLVDTQRASQIKGVRKTTPVHIIDHHPLTRDLEAHEQFEGDTIGATTTLLIEQLQARSTVLNSLEATLLALGIYEDTGALLYRQTTARDIRAAAWLIDQKAALDMVRRFLDPPMNDEQQALFETLLVTSESRVIQGYTVIVGAAELDSYLPEISSVAHRLRDTLDPAGLFMIVKMPGAMHLVCRATVDAIDVGEIARVFGGGGHERAAAATIHDFTLEDAVLRVWDEVRARIRPAAHVADLMSHGAQTVKTTDKVSAVIKKMRRIGHEGFPVVKDGRIAGLLTRRDADRAIEHGLSDLTVGEIMAGGEVTLLATDPVSLLEQKMVESGWGQIPVVDDEGQLLGIVTRTDLIKHWASIHPEAGHAAQRSVSSTQIQTVLGKPTAGLINAVARHAQDMGINLYLVGGVVRDLLLNRRNFDIDFVVEGDGIAFGESLQARYGGQVSSYRPFGTLTWILDEEAAAALNLPLSGLPEHLDFATARNEFYEHPTALPTVYHGSIKLDLHRRDFTINTLAVQLSPAASKGLILDFYGGLNDLRGSLIRVLHSLSFVDDPTRVLRAVRFEYRLDFRIEARTAELMQTALPMLRRITGERLRNEFNLLLREDAPENSLLALGERGILAAIHPSFTLSERLPDHFTAAREQSAPWEMAAPNPVHLYWHVIAAGLSAEAAKDVCDRLLFGRTVAESMIGAACVVALTPLLADPETRPSVVTARLEPMTDLALFAAWLTIDDQAARDRIVEYASAWRHVRSTTTGHSLRELGLEPGPCYRRLLERLRAARLDAEVRSDQEEEQLLKTLIDQGFCDGDST